MKNNWFWEHIRTVKEITLKYVETENQKAHIFKKGLVQEKV